MPVRWENGRTPAFLGLLCGTLVRYKKRDTVVEKQENAVVNIKSQKDFFSGLMFMGVGVAFAWGASGYTIGNGARMGPGYFPLVLGILLAFLGSIITFKALVVETMDGDKIGSFAWRPLTFIILANVVFGVMIGGLPSIGLPPWA